MDLTDRGADINPGSVRYCVDPALNRVTVTWNDVVHFNAGSTATDFARVNTFQLVLTAATVCGAPGMDVEFRYSEMVWHAGTASGAENNGLCTAATVGTSCTPAVAGIDYGDSMTAAQLPPSSASRSRASS